MLISGGAYANAGKHIARIFSRSRNFKIGYEATGAVLAHNLRVFGRYGPPHWPAHHIVPGNDARGIAARDIIGRANIDINSPFNGIFLDPARHASVHANNYYRKLQSRLSGAEASRGADGVREELMLVYREIEAGIFP